jgi:hypothetical protein
MIASMGLSFICTSSLLEAKAPVKSSSKRQATSESFKKDRIQVAQKLDLLKSQYEIARQFLQAESDLNQKAAELLVLVDNAYAWLAESAPQPKSFLLSRTVFAKAFSATKSELLPETAEALALLLQASRSRRISPGAIAGISVAALVTLVAVMIAVKGSSPKDFDGYKSAIEKGWPWALSALRRADQSVIASKDEDGKTLVYYAAVSLNGGALRLLLDLGAKIDGVDESDESTLLLLVHGGYANTKIIRSMELLLNNGADIFKERDGFRGSPLRYSIYWGNVPALELFMERIHAQNAVQEKAKLEKYKNQIIEEFNNMHESAKKIAVEKVLKKYGVITS